jgi:two-component system response regulator
MNNKPILLVDDNPDDVTFTLRAFKQNNISNEIIVAVDGDDDLVANVKLPKVGGLEVLRRIRADPRTQTLPIVVLTTSSEDADIASSYQLGANSFVRKPVVFSEFLGAAKTLGLYWLIVNQSAPEWQSGGLA